jgi:hypothetical protein
MAKSKKLKKFEVESSAGTSIDLSKNWKNATVRYITADGVERIEYVVNEEYLKELDEKYKDILDKFIK